MGEMRGEGGERTEEGRAMCAREQDCSLISSKMQATRM